MPPRTRVATRNVQGDLDEAPDNPDITLELAPSRGGAATEAECWSLPTSSTVVSSLKFIVWASSTPASRLKAPAASIIWVLLAAIQFPEQELSATLEDATVIVASLTMTACTFILAQLLASGLFDATYNSDVEWVDALHTAHTSLIMRDAWWDYHDPFHKPGKDRVAARGGRPAQAAIPPSPGPPELAVFDKISWADCIRFSRAATPRSPALVLRGLLALLGDTRRDETRRDPSARCRILGSFVTDYAAEFGKVAVDSPLLPRIIPTYINAILTILPGEILGDWHTTAAEQQLLDAHVALCGSPSAIDHMMWRRVHCFLHRYPPLTPFREHLSGAGETRVVMERLFQAHLAVGANTQVTTKMASLCQEFERLNLGDSIREMFDAGSTADQVASDLVAQHDAEQAVGSVASQGAASGSSSAGSAPMSARGLEKVLASSAFRNTVTEVAEASTPIERLEVGLLSGVSTIVRYIFFATAWLRTRHELFASLTPCLDDREAYLSRAVSISPSTGEVADAVASYMVGATFCSLFFALKWHELDMVNAASDSVQCTVGGFLALRCMTTGTRFSHVPAQHHYVVEACLVGILDWFQSVLIAVGFAATPRKGYSWRQAVEKQIQLVRFIQGLPAAEQAAWYDWARQNFVEYCLKRAASFFRHVLESVTGDELHEAFLPDGAWFFASIERRLADALPVAVIRRAFPASFSAEPVALLGTGSKRKRTDDDEPPLADRKSKKQKKLEARARSQDSDVAPGSLSSIAKWLSDGSMLIASDLFPVKEMAKELGVQRNALCWPVLCSSKTGVAALALCPDHKSHGDLTGVKHRRPHKFDHAFLKRFTTKATDAQRKAGRAVGKPNKI